MSKNKSKLEFGKDGYGYVVYKSETKIEDHLIKDTNNLKLKDVDYLKDVDIDKLKTQNLNDENTIKNIILDKDNTQDYITKKYNITRGQLDVIIKKLYDQYEELGPPENYVKLQDGIYAINNEGNVINIRKRKSLKQMLNTDGYPRVSIPGFQKHNLVETHILVAKHFIPNPYNKPHINHINGIKTDNNVKNLEWVTPKENVRHALKIGLTPTGENVKTSRLTNKDVTRIRELNGKLTIREISKLFNISESHTRHIIKYFKWKYL